MEIKNKPWVGSCYQEGFYVGKKLMIVNESFYSEEDSEVFFTSDFIENCLNDLKVHGYWKHRLLARLTQIIWDNTLSIDSIIQKWNQLLFYTFNPIPVNFHTGSGTIKEYSKEKLDEYQKSFIQVLNEYKPDFVIVRGNRLYDLLPHTGEAGPILKSGGSWKYKRKDHKVSYVLPIHLSHLNHNEFDSIKEFVSKVILEELELENKNSVISADKSHIYDEGTDNSDKVLKSYINEELISIDDFKCFLKEICQQEVKAIVEWMLVYNVVWTKSLLKPNCNNRRTWVEILRLTGIKNKKGKNITDKALRKIREKSTLYEDKHWNEWDKDNIIGHEFSKKTKQSASDKAKQRAEDDFNRYYYICLLLNKELEKFTHKENVSKQ